MHIRITRFLGCPHIPVSCEKAGRCLHSWVNQKELNSVIEPGLKNFIFEDMLLYMNVKNGKKKEGK
jgi:hypothetical protein